MIYGCAYIPFPGPPHSRAIYRSTHSHWHVDTLQTIPWHAVVEALAERRENEDIYIEKQAKEELARKAERAVPQLGLPKMIRRDVEITPLCTHTMRRASA